MACAGTGTRARVSPREDIGDRAQKRLPGARVEGEVERFKEGEAERFNRPLVGKRTTQRDSFAQRSLSPPRSERTQADGARPAELTNEMAIDRRW
jgi:hypothetical protein